MKIGVHQGSAHFTIVVDVIKESVRNDLVLTSEMMEGSREKFWKWKGEVLEMEGSI